MISAVLTLCLLSAAPELHVSHRKVVTDDGAALALYSVRRDGLVPSSLPPVLMIADVGFGRTLLGPLAEYLALSGRQVFIAELRGQGAADAAHSLRAISTLDLPALGRVLAPEGPVDLIAHGYVGTLALAATTMGALSVRKVVAFNTPATPVPATELLANFLDEGGRFSTLAGSAEGFDIWSQLFSMLSTASRRDQVAALTLAARDLGRAQATELHAWMDSGDLPLDDGSTVSQRLTKFDRPTLLLLGLADGFAPTEACATLRDVAKGPVKLHLYTRLAQGDDYAHVSYFFGERAQQQVFPEVEAFLR